jgi:MbtH protein
MGTETDERGTYTVVVNHEEQYSIWPVERILPMGWREAGKRGSEDECLDYIKGVWTGVQMQPLSLRVRMSNAGRQSHQS